MKQKRDLVMRVNLSTNKAIFTDKNDPEFRLELPFKKEMRCEYGCRSSIKVSDPSAPYFKSKPDSQYDEYFCGCWGFD